LTHVATPLSAARMSAIVAVSATGSRARPCRMLSTGVYRLALNIRAIRGPRRDHE
jgi:hypothetical protein